LFEKISGGFFSSKFGGGFPERYVSSGGAKIVDDWPSVNLLIRRDVFDRIGGFDKSFWPGEDTYFCERLKEVEGTGVLYAPDLRVYHHRRRTLKDHLLQTAKYGLYRGYFAKLKLANSFKFIFFIPALFSLWFILFVIVFIFKSSLSISFLTAISTPVPFYLGGLVTHIVEVRRKTNCAIGVLSGLLVLPSHLSYGLAFLRGYFSSQPRTRLR
jgi:GT2 family glycosyltransferase